jgi:hypothetical protein
MVASLILTCFTAVLILTNKQNLQAVPQKYLGGICLAQAMYFSVEILKVSDICAS